MKIVIVIPIYNEAKRLQSSLDQLEQWQVSMLDQGKEVSFLFVDDGSTDSSSKMITSWPIPSKLLRLEKNVGKGGAVAAGILQAPLCEYLLVMDIDLSTKLDCLNSFLELMTSRQLDIVVADRFHPSSHVERSFLRTLISYSYLLAAHALFFLPIFDTQCGFKLYRTPVARELFRQITIKGFAYEVEVLLLAQKKFRIASAPVYWFETGGSSLSIWRDSFKMLRDLLRLKARQRN